MRHTLLRFALALPAAFLAFGAALPAWPALADDGPSTATGAVQGQAEEGEGGGPDVTTVTIWTIVGALAGGVFLSVFYLLKRRVGGFPENPSWVAPISIMRSAESPDDSTWANGEGHAAHGAHH